MDNWNALFKDLRPDGEKLQAFGFVPLAHGQGGWRYDAPLEIRPLEIRIRVSPQGEVRTEVVDTALQDEPYVLHRIPGCTGHAAQVHEECRRLLCCIADTCFEKSVFKSPQAQAVAEYLARTYGDTLQFLWEKFSSNAVLRRPDNGKWYAVMVVVARGKVTGVSADDTPAEVLVFRVGQPEYTADLLIKDGYYLAYHMNKKHWISIVLDGSVPTERIYRHLDASRALVAGGKGARKASPTP